MSLAGDFVAGECPLSRLPELFKSMTAGNHAVKPLIKAHDQARRSRREEAHYLRSAIDASHGLAGDP